MAGQVDKIKLTSLGMYTVRGKDYCAGFGCVVKDRHKPRNILNLPTRESLHMTVCYMNENSNIEIFQHKLKAEEQY